MSKTTWAYHVSGSLSYSMLSILRNLLLVQIAMSPLPDLAEARHYYNFKMEGFLFIFLNRQLEESYLECV